MNSYGTRIRKERNKKGYTQEFMATKLAISQNAYSKIENDQTNVKAETLEKIAEILEIDKLKLLKINEGSFNFEQKNHDYSTGVTFHQENFEKERQLWQMLDKELREQLKAKDETIKAQAITIGLLKEQLGLGN